MVEGEGGNIIIDTTDDVSQAKEVLSEFQKINQNPIKAIIYTHNHGDHVFGASEFYNAQEEKPLVIAHSTTAARENDFGRRIFESFANEYNSLFLLYFRCFRHRRPGFEKGMFWFVFRV